MTEKVSILLALPVNTVEDTAVQETLRSIASQTYPASLIEVMQIQYAPDAPGAHTSALNAARDEATGAFVIHVSPGVVWDANKVEQQVQRLQQNPSAGACVHRMTARSSSGKTWSFSLREMRAYGPEIGCLMSPPWGPSAAMFPKEVATRVGAYRNVEEALWEYAIRLIHKGHALDLLDEDLAVWNTGSVRISDRRPILPLRIRYPFLKSYLDRIPVEALFSGKKLASSAYGRLVLAGLHQHNDDLDASHVLCQKVGVDADCAGASYWHGMVHRRDPDFDNARYWFRKAGDFPALSEVSAEVIGLLQRVLQVPDYGQARGAALQLLRRLQENGMWDALYFTDLCETCAGRGTAEDRRLLEEIQEVEFNAVFDWTYRTAMGR